MTGLFLRILILSLTCSAVLLPLLLLGGRLRGRYAARTMYVLWLVLGLRMLLPIPLAPSVAPVTVEVPVYTVQLPVRQPAAPVAPTAPGLTAPPIQEGRTETSTPSQTPGKAAELTDVAAVLWAAGMVLFLVWHAIASHAARRRFLRGASQAGERVGRAVVYRSAGLQTPVAMGSLRPVVFLPESGMSGEHLAVALEHELCHIRRHDLWYKAFLLLVNAVHWFNPLVWLMTREAGRSVELCCDDDVLRYASQTEKKRYGEVILHVAAGGAYPALSTQFSSGRGQLKERLINLFQKKKNSAALVCIVLAMALLAGSMVAWRDREPGGTVLYAKNPLGQDAGNERVSVQMVEYDPQTGVLGSDREMRTFAMADILQVCFPGERENTIPVGEKGTKEREKALTDFFAWPHLRTAAKIGQTNLLVLRLDGKGKVEWMTWISAPRVTPDAVAELVRSIRYNGGSFSFTVPREYGLTSDWRIHISGRVLGPDGFMSVHYLENETWEPGREYRFQAPPVARIRDAGGESELRMEISLDGRERSVDLLALEEDYHAGLGSSVRQMVLNYGRTQVPKSREGGYMTATYTTLMIEEKDELTTVYAVALYLELSVAEGELVETGAGRHMPVAITLQRENAGAYRLVEYWVPGDGADYQPSLQKKFPAELISWVDTQSFGLQRQSCYDQAAVHFGIDSDAVVEKLLQRMMEPFRGESGVGAYINEDSAAFYTLLYYGRHTLDYCFAQFEKGGQTGLKGAIMAQVCRKMLGMNGSELTDGTGQGWYDVYVARAGDIPENRLPPST